MRAFGKVLAFLAVAAVLGLGGAWVWAGRAAGPVVEIRQPGGFVGQRGSLELMVDTPGGHLARVEAAVEQQGTTLPVFVLTGGAGQDARRETADRLFIIRPLGKTSQPGLAAGPARIVVRASRPVLYGLREAETVVTKDVQVRLEPPRVAVVSTKHYINLGGSELVVYRATPDDVESGVRVGDVVYRGVPARGVGITSDPALRVAVYALLHDQDVRTPMAVFARDAAGNEVSVPLGDQVFPKAFRQSRIDVTDPFLARVVPAIVSSTPGLDLPVDPASLVRTFVTINSTLRRQNDATIAALAAKSAPEMRWDSPFAQLGNSQVEAGFADHRTYVHAGAEIDRQVHLGFDLAVTAAVPVSSAQRGTVLLAEYLGIYGNCVIVDHGLGVQSLYAHLSSIDVKPGATVTKGQVLGRSGMTGLAGGDHLHFTMLVGGHPVNPVDWWDRKWMQDRVFRKLADAGAPVPAGMAATAMPEGPRGRPARNRRRGR
ncbi:MAG: M23 family metallopeptidase [Vicinamibacterales bacterium]